MAAKRLKGESPRPDSTMLLFTSISLILLTFFIMMTAKANFDETRYGQAVRSVNETFGIMAGAFVPDGEAEGLAVNQASLGAKARVEDVEMAQVRALLAPNLQDDRARIVHSKGQRIVILSSGLLFNGDSTELSPESEATLKAFARIVKPSEIPISVEGHTDNLPPQTEGLGDNWDVSVERALAVLRFLSDEGLPLTLLSAYGYGGEKPMVANNSPANRAKNNRVELVLDYSAQNEGAIRRLEGQETLFDFGGFEFILPRRPGAEGEVY
ncbi:MAG: OmpA family protein [Deltaproteobacteria bacterium]|jgi:chemotaxis protein MotB|nr:OmpA family protein [Deltaproteobacteria bacterium]